MQEMRVHPLVDATRYAVSCALAGLIVVLRASCSSTAFKRVLLYFHPDKAKRLGLTLEKTVEHEEIYKLLGNMSEDW